MALKGLYIFPYIRSNIFDIKYMYTGIMYNYSLQTLSICIYFVSYIIIFYNSTKAIKLMWNPDQSKYNPVSSVFTDILERICQIDCLTSSTQKTFLYFDLFIRNFIPSFRI